MPEAPVISPPMAATQLSRPAYDKLRAEFEDLTTRGRIDVANKIEQAREEGDLKENAGYHAAKDEQGHMEGRIRQLEHLLENAEIVDGVSVYTVLYDGDSEDMAERYVIGNMEEQVEGADVISAASPLGAAIQDATPGDTVTYEAPNGSLSVTVLNVESA
jgi:transcription elongation factor GreA